MVTALSVGPHCVLDLALEEDFYSAESEKPGATATRGYRKVGQGVLLAHLSECEIFQSVVCHANNGGTGRIT